MQTPKRRSEQSIVRESGPFMVTPAALARLKSTLERLQKEVPALIAEVEHTKGFGDFSENAAYQDAKAALRRTYGRIENIKDRLKRAVIIEVGANAAGTVQLGSTVVLEANGKKMTFEILGPHEADPARGRISDKSPLGQALLSHEAGDEIDLKIKDGSVKYRIIEVR